MGVLSNIYQKQCNTDCFQLEPSCITTRKKKTALCTAGCKINTITCQMQVTNLLSVASMAGHLPDNQSCEMYTYMSSKKKKKNCTQG